jgi:cobalamin biosynthesis protein CobD/CbiB
LILLVLAAVVVVLRGVLQGMAAMAQMAAVALQKRGQAVFPAVAQGRMPQSRKELSDYVLWSGKNAKICMD